jgi:hypothetical protein
MRSVISFQRFGVFAALVSILRSAAIMVLVAAIFAMAALPAFAQETAPEGLSWLEALRPYFEPFLAFLVEKLGAPVVAVFAVIGTLRAVFKPLFALAEAFVKSTESTKDDEVLAGVKASSIYKIVAFLLDYLGSIKLPKAKAKA